MSIIFLLKSDLAGGAFLEQELTGLLQVGLLTANLHSFKSG